MGIDNVMAGLNQKLVEYGISGTQGLRSAAYFILNDTERTSPTTPVDLGNLRASRFVSTISDIKTRKQSAVLFGFSANYAYFVHENMNPDVQWSKAGSGPKFLEASLKRNTFKALLIIRGKMSSSGKLKK